MIMDSNIEIRDPIHGFIKLNEWEKDIIDHPVFQRLRRIKQLSWTDMVWREGIMVKWNKYALLVFISKIMKHKEYKLGKTSLQKIIYLLKTVCELPISYSYDFYIYGPYSAEVESDLEYLNSIEILNVSFEDYGNYRGFNITPNKKTERIMEKAEDFISTYRKIIEGLIESYGDKTARELELIGTIVYLLKEEKIDQELLVERINELKPHFEKVEVARGIDEVKSLL